MQNEKAPGPKWSHILIPLVVLGVLVVGYGFLAKANNWWPHDERAIIDTSLWETHVALGFEFKYPSNLTTVCIPSHDPQSVALVDSKSCSPEIMVEGSYVLGDEPIYMSLDENVEMEIENLKLNPAYIQIGLVDKELFCVDEWSEMGANWSNFIVATKDHSRGIIGSTPGIYICDVLKSKDSGLRAVFNSIEFTNEVTVHSGWQTYRNEDFQISYPAGTDWKVPGTSNAYGGSYLEKNQYPFVITYREDSWEDISDAFANESVFIITDDNGVLKKENTICSFCKLPKNDPIKIQYEQIISTFTFTN